MTTLAARIAALLPRFSYRHGSEIQLHEGIEGVLLGAGIEFQREVVAGPADRFDFLCPPGVVIECKVKGSMPEALRQIDRYAARPDVAAVVLVTTRFWGGGGVPAQLHGKPVHTVKVKGAAF